MTLTEQKVAAKKFATKWANKGDEKQDTRSFWEEFMEDVLGIDNARDVIFTEYPVDINGHQKYIDVFYRDQEILIEQKSVDKPLNKRYHQSGGDKLTPFEQGRRYAGYLPYGINARWIIACNFQQFEIHDLKKPGEAPIIVELSELEKQIGLFRFFVSDKNEDIQRETEISKDAGDVVGRLYDALKEKYVDPEDAETQRHLNILVTRLVFCMYAEDAGLFGDEPNRFLNYIKNKDPEDLGEALERLFRVLDMPEDERIKKSNIPSALKAFPYVNGGLFKEENIEIPIFDESLKTILVKDACGFNWSDISPTIFGAVFESTLNPETRRSGGMHYTSIENIHKVIDPLFLDDLKRELREIQATADKAYFKNRLLKFQDKLAGLTFLDPACGSGNFLTESYLCLRKLENIVFSEMIAKKQIEGQMAMAGLDDSIYQEIKVSISQFNGIEINDFAVTVAKTALWIAEAQMYEETQKIFFQANQSLPDFFPLSTNATIAEGNALELDWNTVIDSTNLDYIMGNPPFVGKKLQSKSQKADLINLFGKAYKGVGSLDYVAGWYKQAQTVMNKNPSIRTALVSTNSICQGESVADLWKPIFEDGFSIDFAHRTFQWDSEANIKAHVHCIIVGFSKQESASKTIFDDHAIISANNINAYLADAPDVFVSKRSKPINAQEEMIYGSEPREGGFLLFSEEEKKEFISETPSAESMIKRFVSADDYINNNYRYCLWVSEEDLPILRKSKIATDRLNKCKEFRENSKQAQAHKASVTPWAFASPRQPTSDYLLIPVVSSEQRRYVPIGYVPKDVIVSNACFTIPNAELYTFGIITSNVHMAWMRAVCGRLEMRYRYSNTIVYNNFIWPSPSEAQKEAIEQSAKMILEQRSHYPNSSLADLYDETFMPLDLRNAHHKNDMAVMDAYGFYSIDEDGKKHWFTEDEAVAELMKMYQKLTQPEEIRTPKKQKTTVKVKVHRKQ